MQGLSREAIATQCCCARDADAPSPPWINPVRGIRVGQYWVKFGTISPEEVSNQKEAYRLIDHEIGRVPEIYDYFRRDGTDYLVMEFVDGASVDSTNGEQTLHAITRLIMHLHSFTRDKPGPANGRHMRGLLWSHDDHQCFDTTQELNKFVNSRLREQIAMDLSSTQLVFNHGDLARRNILVSGEDIWLLDWAYAGYLPRSAEIAALRMQNLSAELDRQFSLDLERTLLQNKPLSSQETEQVDCWQQFSFNNLVYAWPRDKAEVATRKLWRKERAETRAKTRAGGNMKRSVAVLTALAQALEAD